MDRLICFPHAGGSANAYMWLKKEFKKSGKKDMEIMIYEYIALGVAEFMSENYKMIPEAVFVSGQQMPVQAICGIW